MSFLYHWWDWIHRFYMLTSSWTIVSGSLVFVSNAPSTKVRADLEIKLRPYCSL